MASGEVAGIGALLKPNKYSILKFVDLHPGGAAALSGQVIHSADFLLNEPDGGPCFSAHVGECASRAPVLLDSVRLGVSAGSLGGLRTVHGMPSRSTDVRACVAGGSESQKAGCPAGCLNKTLSYTYAMLLRDSAARLAIGVSVCTGAPDSIARRDCCGHLCDGGTQSVLFLTLLSRGAAWYHVSRCTRMIDWWRWTVWWCVA